MSRPADVGDSWNSEEPAIGDYQPLRLLGHGGMGEVWLARQISVGRLVALKLLPRDLAQDPRAVLRFRREAEAGGRLTHPNIATVYAAGLANGRLFIAQELVAGSRTVADWIREMPRDAPLSDAYFAKVRRTIAQVAGALQYAHSQGVIHRDIKPQNILLTEDGTPKVVDFGLALMQDGFTVSQSGEVAGTFAYMSPEQAQAQAPDVDHRTDIFSLGVTLYELLTLTRPFSGDSFIELTRKIINDTPPPPRSVRIDVPSQLESVCLRCIHKRREDRFQSMTDLQRAIAPEDVKPVVSDHRAHRGAPRWLTFALAAALAVACALLVVVWFHSRRTEAAHGDATLEALLAQQRELNPYKRQSYYASLAAFARRRVEQDKHTAEARCASDELELRLRSLQIPSAHVGKGVTLAEAIRGISELRPFPLVAAPELESATTTRVLDIDHPISALALLRNIAWILPNSPSVFTTDTQVVLAQTMPSEPMVLRVYPVADLLGIPDPSRDLKYILKPGDELGGLLDMSSLLAMIDDCLFVSGFSDDSRELTSTDTAIVLTHTSRAHRCTSALLAQLRCTLVLEQPDSITDVGSRASEDQDAIDQQTRILVGRTTMSLPPRLDTESAVMAYFESLLYRDVIVHLPEGCDDIMAWLFYPQSVVLGEGGSPTTLDELVAAPWVILDGIVHVGWGDEHAPVTWKLYAVQDITSSAPIYFAGGTDFRDTPEIDNSLMSSINLDSLIRSKVNRRVWELSPRFMLRFPTTGLMVISATGPMHASITDLLTTIRHR